MSIFGKKQEKVTTAPTPLPADVAFHVMPGKYQAARMALPPKTSLASSSSTTATAPTPLVSKGGGKKWVIIGVIALVLIIGGGSLALYLLQPVSTLESPPQEPPVAEVTPPAPPVEEQPPVEEAPVPTPPPAGEPVQPEPPSLFVEPVSSTDTDRDGLTDTEETLYATNPTIADVDNDGYLDGQEVVNLYNPGGNAPIRIADSPLVRKYTNPLFGYTLLYPASWTVRALDEQNPREVLFTAATGEFIQIIVDDNAEGMTATEWYSRQFPDIRPESLEPVFIENLQGVWTKDRSTVYLTKIGTIVGARPLFGMTYNYGDRTEVNFKTTLKMMLQSFRVP